MEEKEARTVTVTARYLPTSVCISSSSICPDLSLSKIKKQNFKISILPNMANVLTHGMVSDTGTIHRMNRKQRYKAYLPLLPLRIR